jgi:hypothetical protein
MMALHPPHLPTGTISGTIGWVRKLWDSPSLTQAELDPLMHISAFYVNESGSNVVLGTGHVTSGVIESRERGLLSATYEILSIPLAVPPQKANPLKVGILPTELFFTTYGLTVDYVPNHSGTVTLDTSNPTSKIDFSMKQGT